MTIVDKPTRYAHCIHCPTGSDQHEDVHTEPCPMSASGRTPAQQPCWGDSPYVEPPQMAHHCPTCRCTVVAGED